MAASGLRRGACGGQSIETPARPLGCADFSRKGGTTAGLFGFIARENTFAGTAPGDPVPQFAMGPRGCTAGMTVRGGQFSLADERDKKRKRPAAADKTAAPPMGAALRSVYQETVEEAIPPEMLDLLSKLD